MSAICGFINLDGESASLAIGSAMMAKLKKYPADSSEQWYGNQVFLGCHHQVVTPESRYEKLPYVEYCAGLAITADAIIDNRTELLQLFAIPSTEWGTLPDSRLILLAYQKWGNKCPAYLLGDYAFVIWNKNKQELFCARDHVGKRTLYFTHQANIFAFGTVISPLFEHPKITRKLNNQWIADFLAIQTVTHELDSNHTVYQNIQQLAPAHYLIVNCKGLKKFKYWDPMQLSEIKFKTEEEYYIAFREIFSEVVNCRLRSAENIGIMLSGGLDSGAVACVASGYLREQGKRLQAYSSIPMEGYVEWLPRGYISDESPYIEAVREYCGNIDVTYCRSEGRDSVSDIDKFILLLEQPYKIVENFFWLDNITEIAAKNGCRILLNGQFGNSTISYGDFIIHAFTLFTQGKLISLYKEISGYSRLHGLGRKKVSKLLLEQFLTRLYSLQRIRHKKEENTHNTKISLVNPALARHYNTNKRLQKKGYGSSAPHIYTVPEYRKLILNSPAFSHIGAIDTKQSLYYGIADRDPTRDKRLIEFCFRIPGNLYVKEGMERHLIRKAMEGKLPDKVRLNSKERGIQSADWLQRISPQWCGIQRNILDKLDCKRLQTYVDVERVKQTIMHNRVLLPKETNQMHIRMLLIVLILARFLEIE